MALTADNNDERIIYLNIFSGKIARSAKPDEPGAEKRINKKEKEVWEVFYKSVDGNLVEMKIEDTDFGQMCSMILQDVDVKYKLTFPVKGDYFGSLAKKAHNIDVDSKMTITPYSFADKDKPLRTIAGLNIYQNGNKVENFITKDNPMDGPRLAPNHTIDEKDQFKLDIVRFYKKQVEPLMEVLKLKKPIPPQHSPAPSPEPVTTAEDAGDDFDDMPWDDSQQLPF